MASQLVTQTQLIDTVEVKGQGTILTGTVLHGSVKVNDNITLPVQGTTKKVRVDGSSEFFSGLISQRLLLNSHSRIFWMLQEKILPGYSKAGSLAKLSRGI